jgi:hypothetical protein
MTDKIRKRKSIVGKISDPANQEASRSLIERIEQKRRESSGMKQDSKADERSR